MKSWFSCRASGRHASIDIFDDIGGFGISMGSFTDAVKALGTFDHLTLGINSGGGDVFTGIGIYNFLKSLKANLTVRIHGLAASIASVIALAGDEVEMPESAFFMIHDPSAFVAGGADDMNKMAETLRSVKSTLVDIYQSHTGLPRDEIEKMMAEETWLNGKEAVANGFATKLIAEQAIAASINLSSFNRVPEEVRRTYFNFNTENYMKDENKPGADTPNRTAIVDELAGPKPKNDTPKVDNKAEIEREASRIADERVKHISNAYRAGKDLGLENECQRLMDDGIPAAEIPDLLIQVFAKRNQRNAAVGSLIPSGVSVGFSNDDPQVVLDRMSDAITASIIPTYKACDASREYRNFRPQDFMRNLLDRKGQDTRHMTRSAIVDAALHTTSDFPNLLGASANKIFMGSYESAPATFRTIAGRIDLANFQAHNMLRDGDFPSLAKVLESGEFTHGSMSESKEVAQLATHGRTFSISRQSLMNDTLGVFGRIVQKIGVATARFENEQVWGVVTTNGNLADGKALFQTADHKNLASSGAAIDATSLGAGRAAMRLQKSLDGKTINAAPAFLVVPAAKETTAEQILYPTTVVTSAAAIATPSMRSLSLVVEPLLDANSSLSWYLFADPNVGSSIVYGYLEGETAPRVRVNDPFNVDGIEFQVRLDFHASAVDYRFCYKNPGA